jgi:hypothetical protein
MNAQRGFLMKSRRSGWPALLSQEGSVARMGRARGGSQGNLVRMWLRNDPSRDLA